MCRETSGTFADGEVVWSWRARSRRQVLAKLTSFAMATVATQAGSPRRARISRKPLCREGRSVSACTCGLRALAHISCAGAPGAAATRPSLLPPIFKGGQRRCKTRAKGAARICSLARRPPAGLIAPLALETRVERCWLQSWATWGPARCSRTPISIRVVETLNHENLTSLV